MAVVDEGALSARALLCTRVPLKLDSTHDDVDDRRGPAAAPSPAHIRVSPPRAAAAAAAAARGRAVAVEEERAAHDMMIFLFCLLVWRRVRASTNVWESLAPVVLFL
jgi:hypothetical protein